MGIAGKYWKNRVKGLPPRVNHAAVVIDGKIYSFGGYTSRQKLPDYIDVFVIDTDKLEWDKVDYQNSDCAPSGIYGHSTVAYGRKVYLWGGQTDGDTTNKVYCFDVDSLEWSTPLTTGIPPDAADGHSACVIGDFMYIFGGYQLAVDRFSSDVYRLHLINHHWERIEMPNGLIPENRDFHTASAIGDRMYIFGGRSCLDNLSFNEEFYSNQIIYLDTTTMTWVAPDCNGTPPCGRRSHSASVFGNEIYIFGGFEGIEEKHFNDVHKFNPETNTWTLFKTYGKPPSPRRRHCACAVEDSLYIFGGSSPGLFQREIFVSEENPSELSEQGDLHVLELTVSLKRLAQMFIVQNILSFDLSILPKRLREELKEMSNPSHCNKSKTKSTSVIVTEGICSQ